MHYGLDDIRLEVVGKIVGSVVVEKVDNVGNVRSENSNKSDRRDNENYRNFDRGEYRSLDARKNNIKISYSWRVRDGLR